MYPVGGPGGQGPGPVGPPGPPQQNPLGPLAGNPNAALAGLPGVNPAGLGVNTGLGPGLAPALGNHMGGGGAPGQTQIPNPASVNPLTTALGTMITPPGQTNIQGELLFVYLFMICILPTCVKVIFAKKILLKFLPNHKCKII